MAESVCIYNSDTSSNMDLFFEGGYYLSFFFLLSFLMTELVGALLCFGVTDFDLVLVPGRHCLERCSPGCAFRIIDSKLNNADSIFLPVE